MQNIYENQIRRNRKQHKNISSENTNAVVSIIAKSFLDDGDHGDEASMPFVAAIIAESALA